VHLLAEERGIEPLSRALLEGEQDYSLVKITPAHLAALRQTKSERAGGQVGTRCFVIGGEALSWAEVEYWRAGNGQTRLINEYGPTETVVGCCVYEVGEEAEAESESGGVPIGRPVANLQMYVLDERMRCVPVGVSGELYIGGVGLARGYRGRAELTAERFVPHPYSREAGARLYRTGDVGKYRPDGRLEYEGRRDEQVKVRGYRIELGEIEAALREHEAVSDAVVVAPAGESGHKRLVAYLISREGAEPSGGELRTYLGERLPEYMVPGNHVWLKQWPLTSNGKVDRRALAQLEGGELKREQGYAAPRTDVEAVLARIWSEALRVEQVGIHDNFFELGGDSIGSLQIIAKAGKAGLSLLPEQIFQYPTVAGLASVAILEAMTSPAHQGVELEPEQFDKLLEMVEFEA
jgi:acyl-coenzyme A synthetase/AMP-(fatty) acid ligase